MDVNEWIVNVWYEVILEDLDFITFAFQIGDGPIVISTRLKAKRG